MSGVEHLVRLVLNQGDDHAIQVEEEHDQVEAQLDKGFLLSLVSPCCSFSFSTGQVVRTFLCTLSFLKISVASKR